MCAALLRVRGTQVAELPLVATSTRHKKKGHCRVFMRMIEAFLVSVGVSVLALPASEKTVSSRVTHDIQVLGLHVLFWVFSGSHFE